MNALVDQILAIRARTAEFTELRRAHHFLYDLPLVKGLPKYDYVVIGTNPGEPDDCCERYRSEPTEETSLYDFHEELTKNSKWPEQRPNLHWSVKAKEYLGTESVIFSEFFFWSSKNIGEHFTKRFGASFGAPAVRHHFEFCRNLNRELIAYYLPKAVVASGFAGERLWQDLYGLQPVQEHNIRVIFERNGRHENHFLIKEYRDNIRPWIFTKHWSGSRHLTKDQKNRIKSHLRSVP